MLPIKSCKCGIILVLFICITCTSKAENISLYTENFKPYQYIDEQDSIKGFGIDLIRTMFKEADVGIKDEIRMAVWNNAYQTALKEQNSAIFMTVRNEKREDIFKWVGPLANREMWLYKLKTRKDIKVKSLSDAENYLIGGYKSAQTDYLIELGFPRLDIVLKEELNFKKLLAGRIDLTPSSEILMSSKLRDHGIPRNKVEKVVIFDDRYQYYLALNKSISDAIVDKLQRALDTLKESGRYQQIEHSYLGNLK
jgi:polar amino acid transport system substrate-binding protein